MSLFLKTSKLKFSPVAKRFVNFFFFSRDKKLPHKMRILFFIFFVGVAFPSASSAFDYSFEGWARGGAQYVFDSPSGFDDVDRDLELRLGVVGNVFRKNEWSLDYELKGDNRITGGPREQAGFNNDFESEFFRGWLRLENETVKIRGGRQAILFGAGSLFRPLGFFDNRNISGVVPFTRGVDGLRTTIFLSADTFVDSWLVSADKDSRVIAGGRIESQLAGLETGFVFQYHPATDLEFLSQFDRELFQLGYHLKGEYGVGYWHEARLDVGAERFEENLRFDSVWGADYTLNVGEGLHVLAEYFLSVKNNPDPLIPFDDTTLHQVGVMMDQPVGVDFVWRLFGFFDLRDGGFQFAPQIEYYLMKQTYLYLNGKWGGNVNGSDSPGRLFRKGPVFNGTESSVGFTLIYYI